MSIVHELGGSFFHNTPDSLLIVHVRRCMMIQDIYFHLSSTLDGETWEIKIPVCECWSFVRERERERERSRIQMQLEEVR